MGAMTVPHEEQNPMTVCPEGWGGRWKGKGRVTEVEVNDIWFPRMYLGRRGYEALRAEKREPARRRSVGRKKKGRRGCGE